MLGKMGCSKCLFPAPKYSSFRLGLGKNLVLPSCSAQHCLFKTSVPLLLVVPWQHLTVLLSSGPLLGRSWGPSELYALFPGF